MDSAAGAPKDALAGLAALSTAPWDPPLARARCERHRRPPSA